MIGHAVLTGDIVASSRMTPEAVEACLDMLEQATRKLAAWEEGGRAAFARRGGDGWQAVTDRPRLAIRAALYLQASLRRSGRDRTTRIAIATGEGPPPEPALVDPNRAHGPAFTLSGRLLQELRPPRLLTHAAGGAVEAAVRLADHIAQGWTEAQARALVEMLPPGAGSRAAAARRMGISRQAVDQALHAAGFPAIDDALRLMEGAA